MPDVFMPRLSDTMTEGSIAQWNKAEGEVIQRGDVLAEIETDKAVMDLEAYESGILQKIVVQPGQAVPIGTLIAIIANGASAPGQRSGSGGTTERPDDVAATSAATAVETAQPVRADTGRAPGGPAASQEPSQVTGRLRATPLVRALARTHGIDLSVIAGSGPHGRIIRADVETLIGPDRGAGGVGAAANVPDDAAASAPVGTPPRGASGAAPSPADARATVPRAGTQPQPSTAATAAPSEERIPMGAVRRVTARRLSEAALVPTFELTTVLDAGQLVQLRTDINAQLAPTGAKISVTDLLVRACAIVLRARPEVNASFGGDEIIRHHRVNVGIAVSIKDGLIVPVINDADRLSVSEIGAQAKDLATRARAGKLSPDEFSGGTFTISNLGMYGIDSFSAVLNPPEAAILAVGATVDEPVVRGGEVVIRPRMRLTLTVDHRVLDGATAAVFMRELTDLLSEPLRVLV